MTNVAIVATDVSNVWFGFRSFDLPYILKAYIVYNGIAAVMTIVGLRCEIDSVLDFFLMKYKYNNIF